jgi:hypothetical protein
VADGDLVPGRMVGRHAAYACSCHQIAEWSRAFLQVIVGTMVFKSCYSGVVKTGEQIERFSVQHEARGASRQAIVQLQLRAHG